MSDTLFTSIISTVGVLISVIVSVIITRSQYKAELEKIKRQLEQAYAKSLFDKRVETYPRLFNLLSGYGKMIQYKKQNQKNLIGLRDELDKWNNSNGLFFTRPTARLSSRFRRYLNTILNKGTKSTISKEDWETITNIIGHFEEAIKTEIGVTTLQPVADSQGLEEIYKYIEERIK